MNESVRPSQIAGLWYEGEPKALARAVDAYMDAAQVPPLKGDVVGAIAPHAGHRYSGPVAGYAFAALRGLSPRLVAVLSPFHNYHNAPLLTTGYEAYATPLGTIPVDRGSVNELQSALKHDLGFGLTAIQNDPEHSLEIELPFLQRALAAGWKLLPIMVRVQEPDVCEALGKAVARVLKDFNAILVASTDLSHYYEQRMALALDRAMLEPVQAFDPARAFDVERSGRGYACGLGALAAVMWAARELGATSIEILRHATSGDVTGDYSAVVGYGAAVILKAH
ncbi:MAG TPA: AmmeMemoRadiSam system protein B [Anaerolineales bacterium]